MGKIKKYKVMYNKQGNAYILMNKCAMYLDLCYFDRDNGILFINDYYGAYKVNCIHDINDYLELEKIG